MPPYPKPPKKPKKPRHWIKSKSGKRKLVPLSKRASLMKELDRLTSQIVILRDGDCVTKDKTCSGQLTCSHYYPRGQKKTRFSLVNCNCQCSTHNNRHNHYSSFYEVYMLKTYTTEQLYQLALDASVKSYKWSISDLEALAVEYRQIYQDLLASKHPAQPQSTLEDQKSLKWLR
jgi:hypothetical protein